MFKPFERSNSFTKSVLNKLFILWKHRDVRAIYSRDLLTGISTKVFSDISAVEHRECYHMNRKDMDLGRRPILYSFRRCPYAIRARFAIVLSGLQVELREIVLRDKPMEFLQASPSATVPCLVTKDKVFDESLDIMKWAFEINDPENFLNMPLDGYDLIKHSDGPFKDALDRVKYASRYPNDLFDESRQRAAEFLKLLNQQLCQPYLFGPRPTLADIAIFPFVRQFAFIDKAWFDDQKWRNLSAWLDTFLKSPIFETTQQKFPKWVKETPVMSFP